MKTTLIVTLFLLTISPFVSAQKLVEAVEAKNYEQVEQYLKNGEKVNKPNKKGHFPLWDAVWNSDSKMVELLLNNGANAKQKFKSKDAEIACLEIAAQEGLLDIATLLVNAGADVHEKSAHGHTPLRIAARNGRTDLVKYFLSKGSVVDTRGDDGATPLEHAASKGHLEIVMILVESGANINIQDKDGDFPLGEAAKYGFIDVVKYLLSKNADTTLKNNAGNTAEELAKFAGQVKVQEVLKQAKKGKS
jgi:ankyrin repeat protein